MENNVVKSKLCFDPRVARKCIHAGCNVIDIKPYRDDPNRTIIVFEDNELFQETFAAVISEFKSKSEASKTCEIENASDEQLREF